MKKGISESKVQRMRNIVTGNYNKSVKVQAGYKNKKKYSEGDIWEEANKTWTIKNGIKQNISKMQNIRNIIQMPLVCPKCNTRVMKGQLDRMHWRIDKRCHVCFHSEVTSLEIEGKYKDFMDNLYRNTKLLQIKDITVEFEEWLDKTSTFVTETGKIEDWSGGLNKAKMRKKFKKELKEWKKHLDQL